MTTHNRRTALITGVSSGLGRMTADRLHSSGWDVLGTARSPIPDAAFDVVNVDVTSAEDVEMIGTTVMERWGRLDALINNAGIAMLGPVEELTPDEYRRNLDVNIVGAMALVRACLPALRAAEGAVIQISSVSAFTAFAMFSAYHASKWGLEGATEALRAELETQRVRVTLVEPASFRTEMATKAPMAVARTDEGRYGAAWRHLDEWLAWHHGLSADATACVDAIVAVASRPDAPFRVPVGEGATQALRAQAAAYQAAADRADAFLASLINS
ncbi:SDR family NAD(P)-dependent oxidoreductase [Microbacterium mangrovi]|uniref:SDR family NAD(P)-dependent oxidoreductase n=1 Tax=Microbacterium mangrovi TaxID=1348253 RepID=UPI00068D530C|nr:SDR family NAD(P)-dependent oxidoreductase [Microbacterium mangrovi]